VVGIVIGIIPGIGGVTSSFLSYKLAKDFSKTPERFGKGEESGVIASEAANSATTGGAMIPMLAIGIPGDPIVAVLMGGLMIQGLTPGPMMFLANKDVIAGIFAAFLVGAVLLLPLGLALLPLFVRVLKIPQSILMAAVLLLSTLGTYALQRQVADLWIMWLFGLVGYLMRKGGFPLAPFVIGVVLGPIFESNLRRTTIMVGGDFWGFMLGRPIALCVLALALAALVLPMVQAWRSRRSNSANTRSQARSAEGL
jgi:putative tricarboxylic transport membrane protein